MKQTCALPGCGEVLSKEARLAGDLYHSTRCARVARGLLDAGKAREEAELSARAMGGSLEMRLKNSIRWHNTRGKVPG